LLSVLTYFQLHVSRDCTVVSRRKQVKNRDPLRITELIHGKLLTGFQNVREVNQEENPQKGKEEEEWLNVQTMILDLTSF
jgi:hypothetical protein